MLFESSTHRLNRDIRVKSLEQKSVDPVTFTFEFTADEPNIYQTLSDKIVKVLNFSTYNAATSALVLNVTIPSAARNSNNNNDADDENDVANQPFTINGDAQLRTALMSCTMADTINISVSTRRRSTVFGAGIAAINSATGNLSKTMQISCTLVIGDVEQKDAQGAFRYRFFPGQENLLENIKEECMDALDLFGSESSAFGLYFKLDGEWIPITGDRAVLEVLSMLTEAGTTSLDARLAQTPPKAPSVNLSLRCIFEGTLREADKITVSEDKAPRFLDMLLVECKALWDLNPEEQVTLFDGTVPPTEFQKNALIATNAKAKLVVDAAKATHEKCLLIRMERGNQSPAQRKTVTTHIHVLYLDSETNTFEQEAEFDFSWDGNAANHRGAYTALADKIRALLHLAVPFDLFLGADAKGDIPPQSVKTDDQVFQFLVNAPEHTQLFCIKNSLHQEADSKSSPLPVGRASYLRALIQDWRQIRPRQVRDKEPLRITSEEMKPIVATWHLTWELKRREILLVQAFEDFSVNPDYIREGEKDASLPVDELFSVLLRWTSYLVDDEVANFARHCQNMIDYLTEISNEARCNRLSARCFSALRSVGSVVKPGLLVEALVASSTVNRPEAESVVSGYSADGIEAWEFDEILTYFFLDDAAAFQKLFGACSSLRTTPDYSQHDSSMKSVRESRLRSELRHALDGIVPNHLVRFAKENWGLVATGSTITVPLNFLDLAWCVSSLLNHSTSSKKSSAATKIADDADEDDKDLSESVRTQKIQYRTKIECWKWLIGECSSEEAAANFLLIVRSTGLSFCSDETLQKIGVVVYNDGLDARLLHATAGSFLSNLAQWCYVLQDLTFLMRNLQLKGAAAVPSTNEKQQTVKQIEQKQQDKQPRELDAAEISPTKDQLLLLRRDENTTNGNVNKNNNNNNNSPSSAHHHYNTNKVKYSPPRATMGLRPTPPSSSTLNNNNRNLTTSTSPTSNNNTTNNVRVSRIMSPRSTMLSAGFGLNGPAPTQNLNDLLRIQKEENLLREFDSPNNNSNNINKNQNRAIKQGDNNHYDGDDSSTPSKKPSNSNPNNTRIRNSADFALFTIKGAAGLVKHPMLHSVDSYIVAYDPAGTVVHQTPVVEGTCSPLFPPTCRFVVPLSESGSVVFHILTESNISGFLGEVTMKLGEALYGGTREVCVKVKPRRGETDELLIEHARDLGHLTVEVVPLKEPTFLPKSEPQGFIVWGKVLEVSNVGVPEPGERRDLYVQVLDRAERPVRRTDCSSRDPQNPKWTGINREFILPLEDAIETLTLKLIDEDLKGGRVFGVATLPAADLIPRLSKEQRERQQIDPPE